MRWSGRAWAASGHDPQPGAQHATGTWGRAPQRPAHCQEKSAPCQGRAPLIRYRNGAGADPLAQTSDGQLPLELVPRAAPPKAPAPVVTSAAAAAAAAAAAEGADAASGAATTDPLLLRAARRSFKTLARAAAEKGGVDEAAAELLARSRESSKSGRAEGGDRGRRREQEQRRGKGRREEEQEKGDPEVDDHPVVVFVRQFSAMGLEQQVAKVRATVRWAGREGGGAAVCWDWAVWRAIWTVGVGRSHLHLYAGALGADGLSCLRC